MILTLVRGKSCSGAGGAGRGGKLRIGMGIIDRVTEGERRMFIPPGVKGTALVRPSDLGVLGAGEAVAAGRAESAADDCPDA